MLRINKNGKKQFFIVGLAVLFIAALTLLCLELTNTTHLFHKQKAQTFSRTPTIGGAGANSQKGESSSGTNSSTSPSDGSQPGDTKSSSGGGTDAILISPSGDFVSNHHPSLSNTPTAPNTISSVCTTTPGAQCTITFTQGTVQKSLAAEATDRAGSAYWNWKLQDVGITSGTWKITATASLNGKTESTDDSLNLEVTP